MNDLLEIGTFGRLTIKREGVEVSGLASSKAQALLVYLAITQRECSRDLLAELLWENRPQQRSMSNLRVVLSSIREQLSPYVNITRQGVAINPASHIWCDAIALETQVKAARNWVKNHGQLSDDMAAQLAQTAELCNDDFLNGFYIRNSNAFDHWLYQERQRLNGYLVEMLDVLVTFYSADGNSTASLMFARQALDLDPLREETYRQLMQLSAECGNRPAAQAYYQTCQVTLAKELGLQPEQATHDLWQKISIGQISINVPPTPTHHLPPQSSGLIAREQELREIISLLQNPACRLLTLSGPGGIGKTHLAREAARNVTGFSDGIHIVSLESVSSANRLASAIAQGCQFTAQDHENLWAALLHHLSQRKLLLVLDDFEHLIDEGVKHLVDLLTQTDGITVLVTSRARLNLQDEWLRTINPLPLPPKNGAQSPETYGAVQLFLQSVHRICANFQLTKENQQPIIQICQQVGGNPLGIKLAAAWMHTLSCAEIATEIQQSMGFLSSTYRDIPERHQSLRAIFEHSWSLLTVQEQVAVQKLTVFSDGFRCQAAASITGVDLPMLQALVDKSFIRKNDQGRYEMHSLIQRFVTEIETPSEDDVQIIKQQHGHYYLAFLRQCEAELLGQDYENAETHIRDEAGNIRVAWDWLFEENRGKKTEQLANDLWVSPEAQIWYNDKLAARSQATDLLQASGHQRRFPLL